MTDFRTLALCLLVFPSVVPGYGLPASLPKGSSKVLIVVAHPDDEIVVAAATYRLTQELGCTVDQLVITNGEGGFHYASLAEKFYGLSLTRESVGRKHLPKIRKKELLRSGKIMGVRKHYFLDQRDGAFTQDIGMPLLREWNSGLVRDRLKQILERERYEFIFTLLPIESTHGHHKAATVLALEIVAKLPAAQRPLVFGAMLEHKGKPTPWLYATLPGYPSTKLQEGSEAFFFDRTTSFGHRNALSYEVIPNWVIAEHKSQGTLQMLTPKNYELETFRLFHSEVPMATERAAELFKAMNQPRVVSVSPLP